MENKVQRENTLAVLVWPKYKRCTKTSVGKDRKTLYTLPAPYTVDDKVNGCCQCKESRVGPPSYTPRDLV